MRDRLLALLERADLALASCAGVVDDESLSPLIEAVRAVRTRLAYPEDVVVAALVGGTGSGKSSLFNTLTGDELADVGGIRPTTSHPAAAIPVSAGASLDGYLDRLEVRERHSYDGPSVCLLDLPDTDSVEVQHRHRVDAILPLVDLVVWVVDPEKYRDARLHDEYLAPMSEYSGQFVFVINQIDRLRQSQLDEVLADFGEALGEDGITTPSIVTVAASPASGPPLGIDELWRVIGAKGAHSESVYVKLLVDLASTSRALESETGSGLDFDARAREALASASGVLVAGESDGATTVLTGLLDHLAAEASGATRHELARLAAEVPAHIRRIEGELRAQPRPKKRWIRRREPAAGDESAIMLARARLSEAVIRPARVTLAKRALAVASVAELALEVECLRRDSPR